jgi:hypothetical protein
MTKKVDIDLLEELAPEMFFLLKLVLKTEYEDYVNCVEDMRKDINGCPKCRVRYAVHKLIEYIEGEGSEAN